MPQWDTPAGSEDVGSKHVEVTVAAGEGDSRPNGTRPRDRKTSAPNNDAKYSTKRAKPSMWREAPLTTNTDFIGVQAHAFKT